MKSTTFPTRFSGEIDLQTFSSGSNRLEKGGFHCNFDEVRFNECSDDDSYTRLYIKLNGSIVTNIILPTYLKQRFVVEMNRTVE